MGQATRKLICFYRYARRREVNPFFATNVLIVEVVWIVLFPDWVSVCLIIPLILTLLVGWGLSEYIKEVKAVRRRARRAGYTPFLRSSSPIRYGRGRLFIGRNGVEVPLGETTMEVRRAYPTVDYTSTTSTFPPRPTPPEDRFDFNSVRPIHPRTNEDFKVLLEDEKEEHHLPKVRKIRGK